MAQGRRFPMRYAVWSPPPDRFEGDRRDGGCSYPESDERDDRHAAHFAGAGGKTCAARSDAGRVNLRAVHRQRRHHGTDPPNRHDEQGIEQSPILHHRIPGCDETEEGRCSQRRKHDDCLAAAPEAVHPGGGRRSKITLPQRRQQDEIGRGGGILGQCEPLF